jgi:TetR/AcrR family transcriptional regulator
VVSRTGGEKTRARILAVAEELFADRGFDATSVDAIARKAGVNKALIYYHFASKDDLIVKLFGGIVAELEAMTAAPVAGPRGARPPTLRQELRRELDGLRPRRRILSLMLAEALRPERRDQNLYRCFALSVAREHDAPRLTSLRDARTARARFWVHEFFTGFIPMVAFIVLRDSFAAFVGLDADRLTELFLDAFERSHLASQHKPE